MTATESGLEPIAIVGMSCRFPGAPDLAAFWRNLRDGVESVTFFSDEELLAAGVSPALLEAPGYVKARAVVPDIEGFDAAFFGYTPGEAELTDPQQRIFLECAWHALEHAGYHPDAGEIRVGVYAGAGWNAYLSNRWSALREAARNGGEFQILLGNDKDFLATRVSYKLNLRGPSVSVNTACSTSLVAVQFACQSLWTYQCDLALAGGVALQIPQNQGYLYQEGGILSPDGHCRAFDAQAQGTVSGSGAGVVALKRLSEAVADGDTIHAVIRGVAINNDGAAKIGYTAPSVEGQTEVIAEAQALGGVDPATITYVEAHGTGTTLGDPIEFAALRQAFADTARPGQYCALGSVKTNFGHLDTAAGIAGLIKTTLALRHRALPPSLHFQRPNPAMDLGNSPFYVNTVLRDWESDTGPRRAGVSSFGIGGTNAHVVLEEAPAPAPSAPARPAQLLVVSARTDEALNQACRNLADHFASHPDSELADAAHTLAVGRKAFARRRAWVCHDVAEAARLLSDSTPGPDGEAAQPGPVAFLLPGQGAQYPGMGRALYRTEPVFRNVLDECAELLRPHLGLDLRTVLYDPDAGPAAHRLQQTELAQPALFAVEYALARLWMSWGIQPSQLLGHSLGEYVAACLAGVFSLGDALYLVARRGQLMQKLPPGAMLAAPLPEAELQPLLGAELALAAVNGPRQCVASGPHEAVERLRSALTARGVDSIRLDTSHAFHSAMMEPMLDAFFDCAARLSFSPPQIPYLSNLSGAWIRAEQATDPEYWVRHLRSTVRFEPGLRTLLTEADPIVLEVGPGQTLGGLALRHPARRERPVLASLPRQPEADSAFTLTTLGQLWCLGMPVDWRGYYGNERRRRAPLPGYPFERRRYWLEDAPAPAGPEVASSKPSAPATPLGSALHERFSVPSWQQSLWPPIDDRPPTGRWLVFLDDDGLGEQLASRLPAGQAVTVRPGPAFARDGADGYTVNPERPDDYDALIRALRDRLPTTLVHLWSLTGCEPSAEQARQRGFYSLLYLAKALGRCNVMEPVQIAVVVDGLQDVGGTEPLYPVKATLYGPQLVIPHEYLNLRCRTIDALWPQEGSDRAILAERLLADLAQPPVLAESFVAYRGKQRLKQVFTPVELASGSGRPARLRQNGVYLITGGLGGVGLEIARYLARAANARLILTGRRAPPPREEWPQWLASDAQRSPVGGGAIHWDMLTQRDFITAKASEIERQLGIRGLADYPDLEPALYRLCARLLLEYLQTGGVDATRTYTRPELAERLRIVPKFAKFFEFVLDVLERQGVIETRDGQVRFLRDPGPAEPLRQELAERFPGFRPMLKLIDHCVRHYGPALSGEIEAIGVLFPDGGEGLMLESAKATVEFVNHRVYRMLFREIVAQLIDQAGGRPLRILEVGGGNGILTGVLAPSLKGRPVEYHFTDLGKSFVLAAQQKAADYGFDFMRFATLDIARDLTAQGFAARSFDIVVGLDVVHATPNIGQTIDNLRAVLSPNGLLCLLETVKSRPWDDMVAGLAEGWWYGEDELRHGPPLLTLDRWDAALANRGFANVVSYPCDPDKRRDSDCGLIIAQQPDDGSARAEAVDRASDRTRDQVRGLLELERLGAEVWARAVDVADREAMARLIDEARARFGAIDGVVHAAMAMRSGAIQLKEPDQVTAEFAAKIAGAEVLDALLPAETLDFTVYCSSVGARVGGFGDVAYCAACNYLDAFAHYKTRQGAFAVAVDWDRWQGVGFARDYEHWHEKMTGRALLGGMSPAAGVEAFERILRQSVLPQIVVRAEADGAAAITESSTLRTPPTAAQTAPSRRHPRPALASAYAPPSSPTEQAIAAVWQDVFSIDGIGRHDDFSELGGDSLIAIQICSRLRERLRMNVEVRALFEAPTVAALAARLADGGPTDAVDAVDAVDDEEEGVV